MRGRPGSVRSLEELGRVRLSPSFFMRDFLHSEIADFPASQTSWTLRNWRSPLGVSCASSCWNPCRRPSAGWRSVLPTARLRSTSSETAMGSAAPRTYATMAVTFGTVAMPRAPWGRWRPSSCHGLPTATTTVLIGACLVDS